MKVYRSFQPLAPPTWRVHAAYNKFQDFVEQLCSGKHDLTAAGHVLKVMLTNVAPVATNTILSNLTEISAGFGYSAGGTDVQNTVSETTGTCTVGATDVVFTASGGSIGPFRYVVLYNDTQTSPADPLIAWWDYGAALTLADGETFTVDFGSNTLFTLA
jgi:hypothetical protein